VTVENNVSIDTRRFGGGESPFPTQFWIGSGVVTGDASAGFRQINMVFNESGTMSLMVSVEQLSVTDNDQNGRTVEILASGFDNEITASVRKRWTFTTLNSDTEAAGRIDLWRPIFLGSGRLNTVPILIVRLANINGEDFGVVAEGYLWDAHAATIPGGPRKFPNGIYSP